ncbi:hypothetical protein [Bradyrhizobium sp. STM 3562]|uniref:hypothetical protein n=1 Tax=Bradyrhizobium sp. STM 3562 TaxID=578924 RepID=UPI00388E1A81
MRTSGGALVPRRRNRREAADGGTILLGGTGAVTTGSDSGNSWSYPIASDAFVIIRPGALLDASGASATLDLPAVSASGLSSVRA